MFNEERVPTMGSREDAEKLAIGVLEFIVGDLDRIIQFLSVTGLQPESIRESAKSPLFLMGVLEYVAKDEELMKEIYRQLDIRPAAIMVAAVQLAPERAPTASERALVPSLQVPRRTLFH